VGEADDAHAPRLVGPPHPARGLVAPLPAAVGGGQPAALACGMANRVTSIVVDSLDPTRLAAWWCSVLGYEVISTEADGAVEIGPPGQEPGGAVPTLLFAPVTDPTPGKVRLHLDLNPTDRDQDAELDRLLDLGATPADAGALGLARDDTITWHVLTDPEGNEFCLLRSRVAPL
jgi:glyoxalase superfamily protein